MRPPPLARSRDRLVTSAFADGLCRGMPRPQRIYSRILVLAIEFRSVYEFPAFRRWVSAQEFCSKLNVFLTMPDLRERDFREITHNPVRATAWSNPAGATDKGKFPWVVAVHVRFAVRRLRFLTIGGVIFACKQRLQNRAYRQFNPLFFRKSPGLRDNLSGEFGEPRD